MNKYFNLERFWSNSFFTHYKFKTMFDYLHNDEPLKFFVNSMEYKGFDEKGEKTQEPTKFRDALLEDMKNDIMDSLKVSINQMIVYMATYLELINTEFFFCIFINDSSRIKYCYKLGETAKLSLGFSFDEFLDYSNKDEYIDIIAKRAAKACSSGTIDKILKRIFELTGLNINQEIRNSLLDIENKRNEIIHEIVLFNLEFDYIERLRDDLEIYLKCIARTLRTEGIFVLDNINLLDE